MQHPAFEAARSAEEWGRQPLGCTVFFSREAAIHGVQSAAVILWKEMGVHHLDGTSTNVS